ncbi:hypothetical protein [Flavobacterium granuli]|uniref:RteC protein n=1 Tax=Flavobacterium granuli TaxID=280093 RepID=A0ABU1S4H3_9FLAO|nr:hypothetical protein [Flavobacterium granuli]MDR6845942.1 hypothetical protein [Flavobacterium granuli]
MDNIVKANANAEIDFPTLDRYKEIYSLLLSNYLGEYKSNTEKRFIELQIEHYKTYSDEFLNNSEYTFNKYQLERFFTDRLILIEYLEHKLKDFPQYINRGLKTENTKRKIDLTFNDFIFNVSDKDIFAKDLKKVFNTESGIDFKIMIELLKEEKIFLIGDRKFKAFYEVCKKYFDREIGSRTGLNDLYKHSEREKTHYSANIEIIRAKLKPLIDKHKKATL